MRAPFSVSPSSCAVRPAAAAGFETVSGKAGALQALFKASGGGASIDELPLEVSLAYEPVRDLGLRAAELLAHIPSNELLLAISRGARRVQALPLSTPLMRVAAAVEALMRTAHEWEALAPARYSLADHTARLSSLVTRWRHMELDGWRLLLDRTAHEHRLRARRIWFALHGMLQQYRTNIHCQ
eukprot:TRINITY_DN2253_c0_g2_i2.p2 TRINITY_DN2253_c0_g2~~TRINITY_DN2253_c0_g2_i2.p2  ORF type:complete len:184 (-),score=116.28 TRINITY_DN2253_c0_g2_i2:26-577(-)